MKPPVRAAELAFGLSCFRRVWLICGIPLRNAAEFRPSLWYRLFDDGIASEVKSDQRSLVFDA
jgi:hypothetical protein